MKSRASGVPGVLRGPRLGPHFGLAPPCIAPHGKHHDHQHDRGDDIAGAVERVRDRLPVGAHGVPGHGQRRGPRDAADGRVDAEPQRGHFRDPGGQRDEGPDHREHPPDEHGLAAVPVEPGDGAIQVVLAEQVPAQAALAQPAQQGLAAVAARGPGQVAAGYVARGAGQDDADQAEVRTGHGPGCERPAERHDQLGRHRDARRFRQHEDEHGEVPVGRDELLHKPGPYLTKPR